MIIKQRVRGNPVELQVVLQTNGVCVEEMKNQVRDKITDLHRNFRGTLIKGVDGAFNALFISVERVMAVAGPALEKTLRYQQGDRLAEDQFRPLDTLEELKMTNHRYAVKEIQKKYPEREEKMIEESKKTIEEAYKYRGRFIQSSIHNFTSKLFSGKGDNYGKRSGKCR